MIRDQPWVESSRADNGIESMVFPSLSPSGSGPPSPAGPREQFPFPVSGEVSALPSVLPSYDSLPLPFSPRVAAFLFWTPYRRLHLALDDAHFEKIKNDLSSEWMTCAMIVSIPHCLPSTRLTSHPSGDVLHRVSCSSLAFIQAPWLILPV